MHNPRKPDSRRLAGLPMVLMAPVPSIPPPAKRLNPGQRNYTTGTNEPYQTDLERLTEVSIELLSTGEGETSSRLSNVLSSDSEKNPRQKFLKVMQAVYKMADKKKEAEFEEKIIRLDLHFHQFLNKKRNNNNSELVDLDDIHQKFQRVSQSSDEDEESEPQVKRSEPYGENTLIEETKSAPFIDFARISVRPVTIASETLKSPPSNLNFLQEFQEKMSALDEVQDSESIQVNSRNFRKRRVKRRPILEPLRTGVSTRPSHVRQYTPQSTMSEFNSQEDVHFDLKPEPNSKKAFKNLDEAQDDKPKVNFEKPYGADAGIFRPTTREVLFSRPRKRTSQNALMVAESKTADPSNLGLGQEYQQQPMKKTDAAQVNQPGVKIKDFCTEVFTAKRSKVNTLLRSSRGLGHTINSVVEPERESMKPGVFFSLNLNSDDDDQNYNRKIVQTSGSEGQVDVSKINKTKAQEFRKRYGNRNLLAKRVNFHQSSFRSSRMDKHSFIQSSTSIPGGESREETRPYNLNLGQHFQHPMQDSNGSGSDPNPEFEPRKRNVDEYLIKKRVNPKPPIFYSSRPVPAHHTIEPTLKIKTSEPIEYNPFNPRPGQIYQKTIPTSKVVQIKNSEAKFRNRYDNELLENRIKPEFSNRSYHLREHRAIPKIETGGSKSIRFDPFELKLGREPLKTEVKAQDRNPQFQYREPDDAELAAKLSKPHSRIHRPQRRKRTTSQHAATTMGELPELSPSNVNLNPTLKMTGKTSGEGEKEEEEEEENESIQNYTQDVKGKGRQTEPWLDSRRVRGNDVALPGHAKGESSEWVNDSLLQLPIAFSKKNILDTVLPSTGVIDDEMKRITPKTLNDLFDGVYRKRITDWMIIDCRSSHEFRGGNIRGAINLETREAVDREFFGPAAAEYRKFHILLKKKGKPRNNLLVIFHCEFSSMRGPKMAKYVRYRDYELNSQGSSFGLHYPEIYILKGGFSLYHQISPQHCQGIYLPQKSDYFDNKSLHNHYYNPNFDINQFRMKEKDGFRKKKHYDYFGGKDHYSSSSSSSSSSSVGGGAGIKNSNPFKPDHHDSGSSVGVAPFSSSSLIRTKDNKVRKLLWPKRK